MIGDSNWGRCPFRWFGWIEEKGLRGGLGYICGKRNVACDPDYCLGPDEDLYKSTNSGPVYAGEQEQILQDFLRGADMRGDGMTKREFLDTAFALAPNEANAIMDAFDKHVDSNEPHWIPVTERLPYAEYGESDSVLATCGYRDVEDGSIRWIKTLYFNGGNWCYPTGETYLEKVYAWMPLPEPYKGATE